MCCLSTAKDGFPRSVQHMCTSYVFVMTAQQLADLNLLTQWQESIQLCQCEESILTFSGCQIRPYEDWALHTSQNGTHILLQSKFLTTFLKKSRSFVSSFIQTCGIDSALLRFIECLACILPLCNYADNFL